MRIRPEARPYPPQDALAPVRLEVELTAAVDGEVHFDDGYRAMYAYDASVYRQTPIGVVIPKHSEDVVAALEVCRAHDVPLLPRGAGTSLNGQCCNIAVVFDFSMYLHGVAEVDPQRKLARVLPGTILDTLRKAAEAHHLTLGPDPATHDSCTLGGMIGNNACGTHSLMAGRTSDNIEELEVLTYDGLRMRVGRTSEGELEGIIAGGRRRREIYAGLRRLRVRYADHPRAFPRDPTAGIGLQPRRAATRERLQRRPGPGRHRGHLRTREELHSTRGEGPPAARARGAVEPDRATRPAQRAREAGPGPLPVLQRLQGRLPPAGRHRPAQGRVPVPLLQATSASDGRLRPGARAAVGPPRIPAAEARERLHATSPREPCPEENGRDRPATTAAGLRVPNLHGLVPRTPPTCARRCARPPGPALAGHVHELLRAADPHRGDRGARNGWLPCRPPRQLAVLRTAALRLSGADMAERPRGEWTFRVIARLIILAAQTLRWRFDVDGVEHVPERGGAVLAWNHHSYLDPVVVAWGAYRRLRRPVRFLAKQGLFDLPGLGWILRSAGHIAVARASRAGRKQAFEAAIETLRSGELIAVAPEQTISESFELLPFTTGAVRMAQAADVPLIPVVGWGAQRVATKGRRRLRNVVGLVVLVRYGRPRWVTPDEDSGAATERLRETMGEMLDDVQRAYPVEPPPGDDWWVPRRLGGSAPPHDEALRRHREWRAESGD